MTGVEAINLVQLIGACISITETVIEIGRAAQDAKGLPSKLKELFERLPAIDDLLQAAKERTEKNEVSEKSRENIKPVLEQCKTSLIELRALFHKACPEDGDNYGKRLWKGTKTVFLGRDSKLQKYMNDIVGNLKILELEGIFSIGNKLDDLAETVKVLAEEDAVRNAHYGSGNQNIHEGPGNQYNIGGGSNNEFTNNFGTTHIHHGTPKPSSADQCLQSLAFPDMEVRGDISEKADDTCEWIFEHQDYRIWIDNGGLLWIRGRAGTGKSTLMHSIRERSLQEQRTGSKDLSSANCPLVVSFFFNRRGDTLHQTAVGLFRSVLHQILSRDNELLSQFIKDTKFEENYRTKGEVGKGKNWDWTESALRDLFRRYVKAVTRTRDLRLYVDALDEGGDQVAKQLMVLLKGCRGEIGHLLSICVSCRPYPERINTYDYCIDVADENREDITRFIEQYFNEWPDWDDPKSLQRVEEEILSRASGVFQWVIIVVPKVVKLREEDLATILASIANLPQDLDNLYHDMFKPLREENSKDKRMALRLFRWITFAVEPLTLAELRYAVAVDADSKLDLVENCKHSAYWCKDDESMLKRLRRLSFGVVNLVGNVVQFDHESVRDYMLARGLSSLEGVHQADSTPDVRGRSEAILSRACFRYLAADDILDRFEKAMKAFDPEMSDSLTRFYGPDVDRDFLLGSYATGYCWEHAAIAEAEGQSVEYILEITEWPMSKIAYNWRMVPNIAYHRKRTPKYQQATREITLQHLAAYHGIANIFEHMLSRIQKPSWHAKSLPGSRSGLDHEDDRGATPLWYAASQGQQAVVKLLLKSGMVDANSQDSGQQTPLAIAAQRGLTNIVRLFLENERTDVNSRDSDQQTPLAIAARYGYTDIVRLFLENERTDVNSRDQYDRTPLATAALHGQIDVVSLFLENQRTDVNSRDTYDETPLAIAVRKASEHVVPQLLARSGIDCNAFDSSGNTPLYTAAFNGCLNITKMLLDHKEVRIWTKDHDGWTPLYAAVFLGQTQIVRLFLERNLVDINSKAYSDNDETPLECAAEKGHASTVRLLLETEEIDMNEHDLDEPFAHAVARGSEETVQLLLEIAKVNTKVKVYVWYEKFFCGTASEIAQRFQHWGILNLIRDYESRQMLEEDQSRCQSPRITNEQSNCEIQLPSADEDDGSQHTQAGKTITHQSHGIVRRPKRRRNSSTASTKRQRNSASGS